MRVLLMLAGLAATSFWGGAQAQEFDWYVGVGAAAELDQRGPDDFNTDAENAWTVLFGANHESGFGAEVAYVDLGRLSAPGIADAGFDIDGELWSFGATWRLQLDQFEPYAKLGWFSRSEDGTALSIAGPQRLNLDDDGLMGELGARWRISDPFALRLGYAWYDFNRDAQGSAQLVAEWHF